MSDSVMPGAVLCGLDASACSYRAARVACAMAQALDAPLLFVHVLGADRRSLAMRPSEGSSPEFEGAGVEAEAAGLQPDRRGRGPGRGAGGNAEGGAFRLPCPAAGGAGGQ